MAEGNTPMTREEERLLDIARAELDPKRLSTVTPITRGPLFAVVGLALLGSVAPFWILWRKLQGIFSGVRRG